MQLAFDPMRVVSSTTTTWRSYNKLSFLHIVQTPPCFCVCLLCAVLHVSPFCFDRDLFHLHHFKICLPLMFPFLSDCFTISPTNVSPFHTLERISRRKRALTFAGSLRCVWVLPLAFLCYDFLNFLFSTRRPKPCLCRWIVSSCSYSRAS